MNFCPACGQRLPMGSRFCPCCGRALTEPDPTLRSPAAPGAEQPAPPPLNAAPFAPAQAPYPQGCGPYAPVYAPFPTAPRPGPAPRPKPPAKPADPMARSYRLTTLSTLVTYGMALQVISVVLPVAAVLCSILFLDRQTGRGSGLLSGLLENDHALQILKIFYVLAYVGGLLLGLLVTRSIRRRLPAEPPERRSLPVFAFLRYVLAAFGLWGVGAIVGNFPSYVVPLRSVDLGWDSAPTWVLAVIGAPILEELIFRKLVLDRTGRFGETPAVLCSALIFGLAHQNAGQFFLAFLLGILFARIYLHTGKIVYTMVLHFMINLTATFDELGTLLWGNSFELWYMIALGVLVLAGILLLIDQKDPILALPGRLSVQERQSALCCWPVTLVKWICVVSILGSGLINAAAGTLGTFNPRRFVSLNPLGLLYLIPAVGAAVLILVLTRRPRRQPAPRAACVPAYHAPAEFRRTDL